MFREILLSKEDFYIKNDNNELLHIEQLNFILGTTSIYMEPYEGVLGLQLPYINSEPDYNIIRSLKIKNIINSYNWFLDLSNIDKGESKMYIGILPHVINKKYDENNMKITNAAKNGVYMNWGLEFSETYYGDTTKNLQKSFKAYIHFNLGLFIGPNELIELLDKEFFNDYINKNICFKEQYDNEQNTFYYCKNTKNFDATKFKTIYLKCNDLENIFELNYKDLFYYKDDLVYFLMIFKKYNQGNYILGEIFLKKYSLFFNQDSKTIGYYKNIQETNENNEQKFSFSLTHILLLLILISIIVVGIIIFFYKNNKNRKIRANELDDNYEYTAEKDASKENKNKNKLINYY